MGKLLAKSSKKRMFWQTGVVALIDSNEQSWNSMIADKKCYLHGQNSTRYIVSREKWKPDVQPTNHVAGQFDLEYFTYKPDPRRKM